MRYAFFKINFLEKISADCRHMLFMCRVCIVQVFPRRNNHFIFSPKSAFFSLMDRHQLRYPGIGYGLYCYKRYRTTRSETTVQKHQWEDITYIVVHDLIRLSTVGLTEWDCVFPPDVCLWCEECGMAVGWPKWMWRRMSVQVWNSRWKNRHNYKKKCL